MKHFALVVALIGAATACGGGDGASDGPQICESDYGEFETSMASCDDAFAEGHRLAIETGAGTEGFDEGLDIVVVVACMALQMTDGTMTADPVSMDLARALNEQVCPGDMSRLVPDES